MQNLFLRKGDGKDGVDLQLKILIGPDLRLDSQCRSPGEYEEKSQFASEEEVSDVFLIYYGRG